MDDRTWYLALGTLVAAVLVVFLDALLGSFETPTGFFPVLGAMLGFLGARSALRSRGNGNGNGSGDGSS